MAQAGTRLEAAFGARMTGVFLGSSGLPFANCLSQAITKAVSSDRAAVIEANTHWMKSPKPFRLLLVPAISDDSSVKIVLGLFTPL